MSCSDLDAYSDNFFHRNLLIYFHWALAHVPFAEDQSGLAEVNGRACLGDFPFMHLHEVDKTLLGITFTGKTLKILPPTYFAISSMQIIN